MTNLKVKAGTIVATSALVLSLVPGVFAAGDVSVTVAENGAGAHTNVTVKDTSSEKEKQTSTTEVVNIQSSSASTGDNEIKGTTGGEGGPSITTGDAKASNSLKVIGGSNTVLADDCGCDSDVTVAVLENGAHSKTKVKVLEKSKKKTVQKTDTNVYNVQDARAKTGYNEIKNSTGSNENTIYTGDATTKNKAVVKSGSNFVGPVNVF